MLPDEVERRRGVGRVDDLAQAGAHRAQQPRAVGTGSGKHHDPCLRPVPPDPVDEVQRGVVEQGGVDQQHRRRSGDVDELQRLDRLQHQWQVPVVPERGEQGVDLGAGPHDDETLGRDGLAHQPDGQVGERCVHASVSRR